MRGSLTVVHARPLAAALDEALLAEGGELLRGAARVEIQTPLQVADRALAVAQQLEQTDPRRVAERAEELGLERIDRRARGLVSPMIYES